MSILIDYREQDSNIPAMFEQKTGITPVCTHLSTGDYIVHNTICVERKTSVDFTRSLVDGRLFAQASRMKQRFQVCVLIVEGSGTYQANPQVHINAVHGALINLAVVWRIPVLLSCNSQETVEILRLLYQQTEAGCRDIPLRRGYRPKRVRNRAAYCLAGFPGVGPALAVRLLEYFGSMRNVCAAPPEALYEVEGIGVKKAEVISQILDDQFNGAITAKR